MTSNARGVLLKTLSDDITNYNEFVEMICKMALQQQTDTVINLLERRSFFIIIQKHLFCFHFYK